MKITLEFSSHTEMMAFCRERVAERGYAPSPTVAPHGGSTETVDNTPVPVALGKRQHAVLEVLSNGAHRETGELAEAVGISVPALSSTLKSLAKRGLVQKVRWGVWGIVSNGGGLPIAPSKSTAPAAAVPPETETKVEGTAPPPETPSAPLKKAPVGKAKAAKKGRKAAPPEPPAAAVDVDDILADL